MNTEQKIRKHLQKIMAAGDVNACHIWKGYDMGTGLTGWHYQPFGKTAVFLGDNADDAMETIEEIVSERAEVG